MDSDKVYRMIAKTMFGLEGVLANELKQIGATNIEEVNRAVIFEGNDEIMFKANYLCRTALRILIPIKNFPVANQDHLYLEMSRIDWERYMTERDTFVIDSTINQSNFTNSLFVSMKAKDAIVDKFKAKYGIRPDVDKDHPDLRINIHIFKEECTVSLDSSGNSLHKRGYRIDMTKAPINEVLSAGLILLSGWDKKSIFIDPMCGSGTNLIEAAMIAQNIPSGYYRKEFGFERWKGFNKQLWEEVIIKAEDDIIEESPRIIGCDSARRAIDISKENIKQAQMRTNIELKFSSFEEMEAPQEKGWILLNPPYGERLDKDDDILALYKSIGDTLKKKYPGFKAGIISSNNEALKQIGLKPSKKYNLYNGSLECKYMLYDLFDGTFKDYKSPQNTSQSS